MLSLNLANVEMTLGLVGVISAWGQWVVDLLYYLVIIESVDSIIESVDSISRDEQDVPLTQYITNA